MNVFEHAMQMELDGKTFYRKLAAEAEESGLQTIFSWLADDEEKHYRVFKAMRDQAAGVMMADSEVLVDSKNVFAELKAGGMNPGLGAKSVEAYQFAMKIEAEAAQFYRQAADQEADADQRNLLLRIAIEEEGHYQVLEGIFAFVNAPNQSLVDGEFGLKDEF